MEEPDNDLRSALIDVTDIDLEMIARLPGSVLAEALQRIHRELNGAEEPFVVEHQSSAG
jgi:FXSXX-COOH protein